MGVYKRTRTNSEGKKTSFWYIRYTVDGKIRRESVGKVGEVTKDVAYQRLNKKKLLVHQDRRDELNTYIPTLSEFAKDYLDHQKNIKQIRSYDRTERIVNYFLIHYGDKKLSAISVKDIDIYKEKRLNAGIKPGTLKRELSVIRNMFYQANRWRKFFNDNPVTLSGMPEVNDQKEKILSYEEQEKLLSAAPQHFKPIILTALHTGMRKSEIISLRWSDVDTNNNLIMVRKEETKSNQSRKIPINSVLRKLFLEMRLQNPAGNNFVFLGANGKPYKKHDSLNGIWRRTLENAEIKGLRFHDLRHTAGTRMAEYSGNIVAVNKILGHADLRTTMRYLHPEDSLVSAIETLTQNKQKERKIESN